MKIRATSIFCFLSRPMLNFVNQNKEQLGRGEYLVLLSFFTITLFVSVVLYWVFQLIFGQSMNPTLLRQSSRC